MNNWQEDQLKDLQGATDEQALYLQALSLTKTLGFEFCAFGIRNQFPLTKQRLVMLNNYPDQWQQRYLAQNYIGIDPTVKHCHRSLLPLVWSDAVFAETPEFWEEARSHGLKHGWAQSAKDYRGVESMLSLARYAEPIRASEFLDKTGQIMWLCHLMHSLVGQLLFDDLPNLNPIHLSLREIEVLKWSSEGKTSTEVASILGLSGRTVNFHINNAMRKMNVVNKTSAVVKAAIQGLL